ncbi:hypothetical protein [Actinoplanes derwentensis]|uniref:hypothetical protein n=1 Tax=Actinoplanes derwentensis TaxID=113562 RepID=UPI0012FE240B|nr:hypothetical protein [Actinoplanes derwentensis]GID89508.1 hypothetical protein Ade03nite_84320 [Actinoplanes derwentensis]
MDTALAAFAATPDPAPAWTAEVKTFTGAWTQYRQKAPTRLAAPAVLPQLQCLP